MCIIGLIYTRVWIVDYLQDHCKGSTLYGFRGGPAGIMKGKYVVLTPEYIYPYRNQVTSTPQLRSILTSRVHNCWII